VTSGVSYALAQTIAGAVYSDFSGTNAHTLNPRIGMAQTVLASRFYHAIGASSAAQSLLAVKIALQDNQPDNFDTDAWKDAIDIPGDIEPVMTEANVIIAEGTV
jgi:hypothetical protein